MCIILFQLAFILSNEIFFMVLFLVNYNNPGFESHETLMHIKQFIIVDVNMHCEP